MIYFLHGNGFPAACYRQFLTALKNYHEVFAEPMLTSALQCEPNKRWFVMRDQAVERIKTLINFTEANSKLHLVGHSMGGYLQMMAAQTLMEQEPQVKKRIGTVVLIESPMPLGLRGLLLKTLQATSLTKKLGPAPIAAKRRFQWRTLEEASAFFTTKSFTRGWDKEKIHDFTEGLLAKAHDGSYELAVVRQIESDIYANVPADRAIKALYSLRSEGISPYFIAGSHSIETGLAGRQKMYDLFKHQVAVLNGGHLITFEQPELCAQTVMNFIKA
jgi:pimeloyl-ACP methyl ester carboxylesterase